MATQSGPVAAPKKGKLKTVLLLVVVVLLAIGLSIAGTIWFLDKDGSAGADTASSAGAEGEEAFKPSQYEMVEQSLVTTIKADGRARYAQVYLAFEADNADALTATKLHMPLLRSQMIGVLAGSDFLELQTAAGRTELAGNLLEAVNGVLEQEGEPALNAVLLWNFVLQ